MAAFEREVSVIGVHCRSSVQFIGAAIQNVGKMFEIILWIGSFFNKVAGKKHKTSLKMNFLTLHFLIILFR